MRTITWVSALVLALWGPIACDGASGAAASSEAVVQDANQAAAKPGAGIHWLGRNVPQDAANPTHVRLSWPGVGLGVRFSGTGLQADMRDDPPPYGGPALGSYWDVTVDGGAATTISLTTSHQSISLAAGLAPGEHELWLVKRTEASLGASEIFSLVPTGGALLAPPPAAARRLEVVGASIETGYGVGGLEGVNCGAFQSAQQNQSQAWPQLLANSLDAELMNTSYSGKGMSSNISISADPVNTMPVMAQLAEPTDFKHAWDSRQWVPDAVAIAMGSNDWEGLGASEFDPNRLLVAYVDFVEQLRTTAPQAMVYVTLSPQIYAQERSDLDAALQQVVAGLRAAGDLRVRYFSFPEYDGSAKGCDGHPPPALHGQMASLLAAQIRADVGW